MAFKRSAVGFIYKIKGIKADIIKRTLEINPNVLFANLDYKLN